MLCTVVLALALATQPPAPASAQQILETARSKQLERWATVDNYTVVQTVNGTPVPLYFEKVGSGTSANFRSVPISEWAKADSMDSKALMSGMALGARMLAGGFRVPGQTGDMTVGPMNEMMAAMLDSMALFADFAAGAGDSITDGRAEAAADLSGAAAFARSARLIGEEVVDGRRTFLLRASGLSSMRRERGGGLHALAIDSVSLWLDATEFVPLRLTMDGTMSVERRSIPVSFEQRQLGFIQVGPLYEPQRQVMRVTGMLEALTTDPRRRRELEEMRRDMDRMKVELARMQVELARLPAAQRRFVEDRMSQAMSQIEMMISGNTLEMEVQRKVRDWNKGPPLDWRWGGG